MPVGVCGIETGRTILQAIASGLYSSQILSWRREDSFLDVTTKIKM